MKTIHKFWDIFKVRGGILYSLMSVCCRIVDLKVTKVDSWGDVTCKACLRLKGKGDRAEVRWKGEGQVRGYENDS